MNSEPRCATCDGVMPFANGNEPCAKCRPDSALLPCPFCGGEAVLDDVNSSYRDDDAPLWGVGCDNEACLAEANSIDFDRDVAIAAWNTRTRTASQAQEIAALRSALERLGSSEGMTGSFALANNMEAAELRARLDFARAALSQENE